MVNGKVVSDTNMGQSVLLRLALLSQIVRASRARVISRKAGKMVDLICMIRSGDFKGVHPSIEDHATKALEVCEKYYPPMLNQNGRVLVCAIGLYIEALPKDVCTLETRVRASKAVKNVRDFDKSISLDKVIEKYPKWLKHPRT